MFGDSAYGTGEFQQHLDDNDIDSGCRTQPPSPLPGGLFAKDRFNVDLEDDTVTCPNGVTVSIRRGVHGDGTAHFAEHCTACRLRAECTNATDGRTISINVFACSKQGSRVHAHVRPRPAGRPTTAPTDPKSNANSHQSSPTRSAQPRTAHEPRSRMTLNPPIALSNTPRSTPAT